MIIEFWNASSEWNAAWSLPFNLLSSVRTQFVGTNVVAVVSMGGGGGIAPLCFFLLLPLDFIKRFFISSLKSGLLILALNKLKKKLNFSTSKDLKNALFPPPSYNFRKLSHLLIPEFKLHFKVQFTI